MEQLPERLRKIILWSVVVLVGAALFFWWGRGALEKFQSFPVPNIPQGLKESIQEAGKGIEFPAVNLEIPSDIQEQLKSIQDGPTEGQ